MYCHRKLDEGAYTDLTYKFCWCHTTLNFQVVIATCFVYQTLSWNKELCVVFDCFKIFHQLNVLKLNVLKFMVKYCELPILYAWQDNSDLRVDNHIMRKDIQRESLDYTKSIVKQINEHPYTKTTNPWDSVGDCIVLVILACCIVMGLFVLQHKFKIHRQPIP